MENSTWDRGNLISLWLFNLSNCLWKIQPQKYNSYIFSLDISKQWKVIRNTLHSFFFFFLSLKHMLWLVHRSNNLILVSFWSFSQTGNINQFLLFDIDYFLFIPFSLAACFLPFIHAQTKALGFISICFPVNIKQIYEAFWLE